MQPQSSVPSMPAGPASASTEASPASRPNGHRFISLKFCPALARHRRLRMVGAVAVEVAIAITVAKAAAALLRAKSAAIVRNRQVATK